MLDTTIRNVSRLEPNTQHPTPNMAKTSQEAKAKMKPKFSSRLIRRCFKCGRRRGYMRDFGLCRICFRELANKGEIPGVTKSSW